MTIIQPNKYKDVKRLIFSLGAFVLGITLLWVFVYLQTVSLRHDIVSTREGLELAKIENAELKSQYYGLVDSDNLENLATEQGFVKDKNPQWAFASRL